MALFYTLLAAVTLALLSVLADFCFDPHEAVKDGLALSETMETMADFYTSGTCTGDDIIGDSLSAIADSLETVQDALEGVSSAFFLCNLNNFYNDFYDAVERTQQGIDITFELTQCDRWWGLWNRAVPEGTCASFFDGTTGVWFSQLATVGCLMLIVVLIALHSPGRGTAVEEGEGGTVTATSIAKESSAVVVTSHVEMVNV